MTTTTNTHLTRTQRRRWLVHSDENGPRDDYVVSWAIGKFFFIFLFLFTNYYDSYDEHTTDSDTAVVVAGAQ
jgi:hypothetical protein